MNIFLKTFFLLCTLTIATIGGGVLYLYSESSKSIRPELSEKIIVEIPKGTSGKKALQILESSELQIPSEKLYWIGRLNGKLGQFKAGEYEVSGTLSPLELLDLFSKGLVKTYSLTIPEGSNLYQIADKLDSFSFLGKEAFLELVKNPSPTQRESLSLPEYATLEGYLFPDTYLLTKGMNEKDLIKLMTSHFEKAWTSLHAQKAKEHGFTRHEAVILASMIEKETGAPFERPRISSVFHNRLKKKMRLQSDPTTIYGIWERYTGNLKRSDLLETTPYNTYKIPALPLGPIANPGEKALTAALFPEETKYLYFVSRNDGTHLFTETYKEHSKGVVDFQKNPKAREGKSWRDLKK